MTKRDLAEVLLKITGVYALFLALPHLAHVWGLAATLAADLGSLEYRPWMYAVTILPFLFTAVPGLALLIWGRAFARVVVREDSGTGVRSAIKSEDLQAIAFSVVAVVLAINVMPRVATLCSSLWQLRTVDMPVYHRAQVAAGAKGTALGIALQLGLALVLFLQARGLAALWHKIRTGGIPGPDDAADR